MRRAILASAAWVATACTASDRAPAGGAPRQPAAAQHQDSVLSFAGITLVDNFDEIAAKFPASTRIGDYVYVSKAESHDHISGIGLEIGSYWRRLKIGFETRASDSAPPEYPSCDTLTRSIAKRYGTADSVSLYSEEVMARADRYWTRAGRTMVLLCFAAPGGPLLAEGVNISRQTGPRPPN